MSLTLSSHSLRVSRLAEKLSVPWHTVHTLMTRSFPSPSGISSAWTAVASVMESNMDSGSNPTATNKLRKTLVLAMDSNMADTDPVLRARLFLCLGLAVEGWAADDSTNILIHPDAIDQCLKGSVASNLVLSTAGNPYYLRGDFDGDGKPDYAVSVRGAKTKRNGILFCMGNKQIYVVGADQPLKPPFSDMPDDNFVAPNWQVLNKAEVASLAKFSMNVPHPVPRTAGEAVALIWEDGIALIYWDGRRFQWAGSSN